MLNKTDLVWTRYLTNLINTKKNKKSLHLSFRGQSMELTSIKTDWKCVFIKVSITSVRYHSSRYTCYHRLSGM